MEDEKDTEKHGPETVAESAERLRREDPDKGDETRVEISTRGGSVTVTPGQMKNMAKVAGDVQKEMES